MPKRDPTTEVANRLVARRVKLGERIREKHPVGFAKVHLSPAEFMRKAQTDPVFRQTMAETLGEGIFLDMVTGDDNVAGPAAPPVR